MAVSTNFILRRQSSPNKQEFPIMMQIIINRKNQLVSTKKYSKTEFWIDDEQRVSKSHPQFKMINSILSSIYAEVNLFILSCGIKNTHVQFDDIKSIVKRLTGHHDLLISKKLYEIFDDHIAYLKSQNRLGYAETFKSTLNSIKTFAGERDIDLNSIKPEFLRNYEDFLTNRKCALTTQSVYFRTFRTLWKLAIRDKHCLEENYPFKDFAFSKFNNPRTKKRAITKTQLDELAAIIIPQEKDALFNSRCYFLFSFYCRGLNFTDLAGLKWTNIKDGDLHYVRAKTKEEFRFRLHPEASKILEYYKTLEGNSDAGYIFPIIYKRHHSEQSIRDRKKKILKRVNKDMKELGLSIGIEKTLTTYVARHSYATALRRSGISKENIGQSLGHDNIKTTEIYLEDIGDPILDDLINNSL